jgi:hypothetical protein
MVSFFYGCLSRLNDYSSLCHLNSVKPHLPHLLLSHIQRNSDADVRLKMVLDKLDQKLRECLYKPFLPFHQVSKYNSVSCVDASFFSSDIERFLPKNE